MFPTFQIRKPAAFVPAIERISLRMKEQVKQVPAEKATLAKQFEVDAEGLLAWCEKHRAEP